MKPKKYFKPKKKQSPKQNFINGKAVKKGKKHIQDQNIFVGQLYMKNNVFIIKIMKIMGKIIK